MLTTVHIIHSVVLPLSHTFTVFIIRYIFVYIYSITRALASAQYNTHSHLSRFGTVTDATVWVAGARVCTVFEFVYRL